MKYHKPNGNIAIGADLYKIAVKEQNNYLMDREKKRTLARQAKINDVIDDALTLAVTVGISDICEFHDKYPSDCADLISAIATQQPTDLDGQIISNALADVLFALSDDRDDAVFDLEQVIQDQQWDALCDEAQSILSNFWFMHGRVA